MTPNRNLVNATQFCCFEPLKNTYQTRNGMGAYQIILCTVFPMDEVTDIIIIKETKFVC